jgi:hypothetical protein
MSGTNQEVSFSRRGNALVGQEMFNLLDYAKGLEREGRRIYHLELGYVGARIHQIPLAFENGFQLTEESIDKALSYNPKVIFVNSGNNPTGAVYSKSILGYLVAGARKKIAGLSAMKHIACFAMTKIFQHVEFQV